MTSSDIHNTSSNSRLYSTIIFDLGDVLFTWTLSTPNSPIGPKLVRKILHSSHWSEYEKGNLDEAGVYLLIGKELSIDPSAIKEASQAVRDSLQSNKKMLEVIRELREAGLSIYAMSNISAPDWEVLRTKATPAEWALFDHTFTSASARQCKPNIGFFKHVIEKAGIDPSRTIFIDDKLENVLAARSFGMYGIIFDDQSKVIKDLRNLCYDPILRGKKFLAAHKNLKSITSNDIELLEVFSPLVILLATGNGSCVDHMAKYPGQYNLFNGGVLADKVFPNDLDMISIYLTVYEHVDRDTKHEFMNRVLGSQDPDGIVQVYFDHSRPCIDPIVCVNVLNLFYKNKRGHELSGTLDWIEQVLINRAYISGTYYYVSADHFLFFLSRLLQNSVEVRQRLGTVFKERVMERFGVEGDSLSLAARIIAATVVDLVAERDLMTLLSMQCEDGSWGDGWFWRYGLSRTLVKNDGVTTALAICSIEQVQSLRKGRSNSPAQTSSLLST